MNRRRRGIEKVAKLKKGKKLGRFQIKRVIGEGAMGIVYLAQDTQLGRPVALKVLTEAVTTERKRLARFKREARLLAKLDHWIKSIVATLELISNH